MGITKIGLSLAKTAMKNKKMLSGVGLFSSGIMIGNLLSGKKSEPEKTVVKQNVPKTPVQKPSVKPKTEENDFMKKYVSPKVGENGIVDTDTIYRAGTKVPEMIIYRNSKQQEVYRENFDKQGKLESFMQIYPDKEHFLYQKFDNKGEQVAYSLQNEDGSQIIHSHKTDIDGRSVYQTYDKNGRILNSSTPRKIYYDNGNKYYTVTDDYYYKYKANGNYTVQKGDGSYVESVTEYDKNDKELSKKVFKNGILDYNVVHKFDKDGNIIKNDTIYNR